MLVKSEKMELRGIELKTSGKTGKAYKVCNMEVVSSGAPFSVYVGDGSKFPSLAHGKKGDLFSLTFNYNSQYKQLDLFNAEKVQA